MKHYKSERLKKLESELADLEQWLKLGLVPKRDIDKHKEEIQSLGAKIDEEKERLQFLKDSGEAEEYIAPKRNPTRAGYTEMPTLPDVEVGETQSSNYKETSYGIDTENGEFESTQGDGDTDDEDQTFNEDDESYFSDRNRWRRGRNIIDPDADEW